MNSGARPARTDAIFRWSLLGFAGLIMVGWMIFAALDTPTVPDNYTNGFSHSPGGHSALVELFEANGRDVRVRAASLRLPAFDNTTGETLALLEPRREFVRDFKAGFERVFAEAMSRECSMVFAFPKRFYKFERVDSETEVINEYLCPMGELEEILELTGLEDLLAIERPGGEVKAVLPGDRAAGHNGPTFEIPGPAQFFRFKRDMSSAGHYRAPEVLVETENGEPIAVRLFPKHNSSTGGIVLLADPDMVSNRFLGRPGAATLSVALFRETPRKGPIVFEETLHGFAADSSVEYLALSPPGLWVTLSLVLLLVLFGWREATVVRPAAAEAADRQARIYAVDGIARMMARARDHNSALRALVKRARLVIGGNPTTVLAEGSGASEAETATRIMYASGRNEEEKLVNAAASIARKMRAGDAPQEPQQPLQGKA